MKLYENEFESCTRMKVSGMHVTTVHLVICLLSFMQLDQIKP